MIRDAEPENAFLKKSEPGCYLLAFKATQVNSVPYGYDVVPKELEDACKGDRMKLAILYSFAFTMKSFALYVAPTHGAHAVKALMLCKTKAFKQHQHQLRQKGNHDDVLLDMPTPAQWVPWFLQKANMMHL